MIRSSGILMAISSLPSNYGIGTLGKEAYKFADFLKASGQSYWQLLPLGPTGYGDSPYSSFSTFAGNPYYIDLDMLIEDGLLDKKYVNSFDWGSDKDLVDYGKIYESRFDVLRSAYDKGYERDKTEVEKFKSMNFWLEDYAFFMALKRHFDMKSWLEWDDENIRLRRPDSMEWYKNLLHDDVEYFTYLQFLFYKQWDALRTYVHELGIKFIGDLPIYVSSDSADVWREPQFFQLDEKNIPTAVAGCPPDFFAKDGQLWGNPLYDWEALKNDGYGWWIRRVEGAIKLFDVIRIDHFRGFESYWSVPFGDKTARNGKWVKGPDIAFVKVLRDWFYDTQFIAEDLGSLTPEVGVLLEESGFPGMKVLEFAFDPETPSNYLPHTYEKKCICYVGTHDNDTVMGWISDPKTDKKDIKFVQNYLNLTDKEGKNFGIIRGGMASVAELFIAQMQDYLGLSSRARMNIPGTSQGNWRWRIQPSQLNVALSKKIDFYTEMYGRGPEKLD